LSIVMENLTFSYDGDAVLRDVSLAVDPGLTHLVLGPTGCGKSTLALLMVGLLRPQRGTILVDGNDPAGDSFPRHQIQLAFQFPESQMFELTVAKEISYGLKNFGVSADETEERSRWALDCMGLPADFLGRDPHNLSFGERRKVALASVIALKPRYLILDEPLAGLDWNGRRSLVSAIGELGRQGMTAVILTHEADLVGEMGDMVLSLSGGRISRPVPAAEFLYEDPGPDGPHTPEFIRLLHLMAATGYDIPGRPLRLTEVADAIRKALGVRS
jgi:energy-coupling factor transporter ATP-binding protein EcfA2